MFDLHKFVVETLCEMVGKEPEYRVRQYSLGWLEKKILTEDDLARIEALLEEARPEPEEVVEE